MTSLFRRLACVVLLTSLLSPAVRAQGLSTLLEQVGINGFATEYFRPAVDAVGYSFNSSLYHSAKVKEGFHFWVGVKGIWTVIPNEQRTFRTALGTELKSLGYQDRETPTVLGGKADSLYSTNPAMPSIPLPPGIDQKSFFTPVPHIAIGSVAGTEVLLRILPEMTVDESVGKVSMYGIGIKHEITAHFPSPVSISIMGFAQRFSLGPYVKAWNLSASLLASYNLGVVTVFGGLAYESYDLKLSYTYHPTTSSSIPEPLRQPVTMNLDYTRKNTRKTLGVNFTLIPLVDLTAEYCFGIQNSFSLGAGVTL